MLTAYLESALAWLSGLGPLGPALYFALFVVANTALFPASLLTAGAGYAFGLGVGLPLCALARPTAALCGFALARGFLHEWVAQRAARYPRLAAVDRAIREDALRIVLLLRLSPLFPSTATNYLLGITQVRLWPFLVGSAVGTLPSTLLGVTAGTGLSRLDAAGEPVGDGERVLWIAGLVATAALLSVLYRAAKRELETRVNG